MHTCIISLAANCDQEKNLAEARLRLSQILSDLQYTRQLWTEPIHSLRGEPYLNQLLRATCELPRTELERQLKLIECQMGRTDEDRKQGIVRIDLDLMQFDGQRYHLRDWQRPYIQQLLA